eukprot:2838964-Pyramimonas_sp.AAC.1
MQNSQRARARAWFCCHSKKADIRTQVEFTMQAATVKGSRSFPNQYGDFFTADNTEPPTGAHARAREVPRNPLGGTYGRANVIFKIQSATVKGQRWFPS